ncbi:hypothetical protein JTE90_013688 [Oedothorax gibbosus]|uniref:LOV domain-containing protein n=1 Tax=Oedothorax gibbosus TaxID=931172 RepID=A0AAV6UH96_9ARAC|nr:hypothetical protein JTE90_013688 [Oedothorax gibbosus]
MPVKRGHVAPQNTFIESIIRKFDNLNRKFLVANAEVAHFPIIFCNDGFCELVGWSRAELMQRSCVCEFLHGPLTSPVQVQLIKECLNSCHEKQLEILYYKRDGTKFLCSQVTAPIRNEDGLICMFIVNFEDITNAPYRDAVVSPLPRPARILLNRFPALWRLVPRSRLKPRQADEHPLKNCEARWKKMKQKLSRSRPQPQEQESPDSPQRVHRRDGDSQSTRGDYAAPRDTTALEMEDAKTFSTTTNNLAKSLPNASSDPDLPRFRLSSPSDLPEMVGAVGWSRGAKESNSQSSTTSKFLKDMQAHSRHHVGEKVAQLRRQSTFENLSRKGKRRVCQLGHKWGKEAFANLATNEEKKRSPTWPQMGKRSVCQIVHKWGKEAFANSAPNGEKKHSPTRPQMGKRSVFQIGHKWRKEAFANSATNGEKKRSPTRPQMGKRSVCQIVHKWGKVAFANSAPNGEKKHSTTRPQMGKRSVFQIGHKWRKEAVANSATNGEKKRSPTRTKTAVVVTPSVLVQVNIG